MLMITLELADVGEIVVNAETVRYIQKLDTGSIIHFSDVGQGIQVKTNYSDIERLIRNAEAAEAAEAAEEGFGN